ncbi:hypothetical protein [Roseospira visakhapatnamensis]|uniref:Uncharacterized protein n=1 Tax=Roseospira visakhapatnamensis TaxID=390880 RepID=A0A7W6RFW8_9PROT|nr:hypothetical protein [Roseospira visakhapatnamensis]MBB4267284.1 hypothetical protein [Roseospira visakhapatnamensis]
MPLETTLGLLAGLLPLLGLAAWRVRRPWRPGPVWRIPWGAVAAVCLVLILGLLAHLISLWSGRPLPPRGL